MGRRLLVPLICRGLRPGRPQVRPGGSPRSHRHLGAAASSGRGRVRSRRHPWKISFLSRRRRRRRRFKRVTQLIASGLLLLLLPPLLLLSLVVRAVRGGVVGGRRRRRRVVAGHGPRSLLVSIFVHDLRVVFRFPPGSGRYQDQRRVFSLQLTRSSASHHRLLCWFLCSRPPGSCCAPSRCCLDGWRPSFFEGARSLARFLPPLSLPPSIATCLPRPESHFPPGRRTTAAGRRRRRRRCERVLQNAARVHGSSFPATRPSLRRAAALWAGTTTARRPSVIAAL